VPAADHITLHRTLDVIAWRNSKDIAAVSSASLEDRQRR
jgi:hypothetical protein